MPELETKLRAAAPRETHAPAHLEATIWAALSRDTDSVYATAGEPSSRPDPLTPLELVIGDEPPAPRGSHARLVLGVLAAAAILIGAVVLAGLRSTRSEPASGTTPAPVTTTPAATAPVAGRYYVEGTCPDTARGACFDPFPAGRYSFHKANPQLTLAVPAGWRNDQAWPAMTVLSRPDTPGATLEILNDARAVRLSGCDVTVARGTHTASHLVTQELVHRAGVVTSRPTASHVGERLGYQVDMNVPADFKGAACSDFGGAVLLGDPDSVDQPTWLLFVRPGESARIVLANGSHDRTLALVAQVRGDQAELEAWLRKAQPVIDSITFAPCTHAHIFYQPCEDVSVTTP